MKKQKRDSLPRAHARGYNAGLNGRSKEVCPHSAGDTRQEWLGGWREGRADAWNGMNGVSALHRMRT